jgi:Zn-finger nucleic acid-binding protein
MISRTAGGVAFDECDHCGGLWLAPAVVEGMAAQAETRALLRAFDPPAPAARSSQPPSRLTYRKCPVCGKLMNRTGYATGSGVVMDACRNHGTYFDRGELTRIFTFIEGGGMEKARRREAEALKDELRDLRRKAISAGGSDSPLPMEFTPSPTGTTVLDLLRRVATHWLTGR